MSYIIEYISPLITTKLTALGRQKLAKGELNFEYWSLGDSEFDYNNIDLLSNGQGDILQPKSMQPLSKSYLRKRNCDFLYELANENKGVQKCIIRNTIDPRGFFSSSGDTKDIIISSNYFKTAGYVDISNFNGTNQINLLTNTNYETGDYILFKVGNVIQGDVDIASTEEPILYLWYQLEKTPPSTIITLDRMLPDFSSYNNVSVAWMVFPGGESIENYYSEANPERVWNSEVLEFTNDCEIPLTTSPVWNMNNVWSESVLGTQPKHETYKCYGSTSYLGTKEYLGYNKDCPDVSNGSEDCEDKLASVLDDYVKGISIIHYSNLNKLIEYGEFLYINNNNRFKICLPTIMYHRRFFSDGVGDKLGMDFVSDKVEKFVEDSEIPYYDLIEDPSMVTGLPKVVGKVFHTLKIAVFHDEEILAALSYKSNRNFTLPYLEGTLIRPVNGLGTGVLPAGKAMYMTYALEADDGLKYTLPHQKYTKFVNSSNIDRDIDFAINDKGLLPYMRKKEFNWDGYGFYANRFKVLVQIVDNPDDRPNPSNWSAIDFTSNNITSNLGESINPTLFEQQLSENTGFRLTQSKLSTATTYDLSVLYFPEGGCGSDLQLGDERFLYGNVHATIASVVYKSIFNIVIDGNEIVESSNRTWDIGNPLFLTEIPIYDSNQELVMITKLSKPLEIEQNYKIGVEIQMDF